MKKKKPNTTETLLGPKASWPGASLQLYDIHPQEGGLRIFIYGTGQTLLQRVAKDKQEIRYEFNLDRGEVERLFQLCLKHDVMGIEPLEYSKRPRSAATLSLSLVNAAGVSRLVHHWPEIKNSRFEAVYNVLLALDEYTRWVEPSYYRRFDSLYRPRRGWDGFFWESRKKIMALKKLELADLIEPPLRLILVLAPFLPFIVVLGVQFALAYWLGNIDPTYPYGFWGGTAHGLVWNQNIVIALFSERESFAPLHSGWGYQIGFGLGITFISILIWFIGEVYQAFLGQR